MTWLQSITGRTVSDEMQQPFGDEPFLSPHVRAAINATEGYPAYLSSFHVARSTND